MKHHATRSIVLVILAVVLAGGCGDRGSTGSTTTGDSSSRSSSTVAGRTSSTSSQTLNSTVASGGPPVHHYECYNSGSYFGYVDIPRLGVYSLNGGAQGSYTYDAATRLVTFTSGQFHDYKWGGHWYPHGSNPSLNSDTLAIDENDLKILCRP